MSGEDVALVKLGGSVITDKARLREFRREACMRLAREMRAWEGVLVVVHGAGSFGHILAKEHRLHEGYRDDGQLKQVAVVQRDVRELNVRVIEALIDNGVKGVSVPPAASAAFDRGAVTAFDPSLFLKLMNLGLSPVTFGDVVPDSTLRFSICSGDVMMEELARHLKPRKAVFCADVDGVFSADPKDDAGAELIAVLDRDTVGSTRLSPSARPDVTGSMHGKMERMLAIAKHCEKCIILNGDVPGRLEDALTGKETPSTTVLPG